MLQTELTSLATNDLLYTSKQIAWLEKARQFADAIPLVEIIEADTRNVFRRDLFEKACQEGFGALPFDTKYGGAGGDYVSFCLINEEFARRCVPVMSSIGVHILSQEPIYHFGTEEQKQKYLPFSSSGKYLAAFGLTEPEAGSDTAALKCLAVHEGQHYVLNGTKVFITSGASADYFLVISRLKGQGMDGGSKSISAFIVERRFPGFEIGQKFDLMGMRGYSTCEIVLNNCMVPCANLLGEPGWGRKVALSSLAKGRVTIASQATGWAQGALETLRTYLRQQYEAGQIGKDLGGVAVLVGELAMQVAAARALTYQAASTIDSGHPQASLASMAKVQATDIAMKAATEAISILGPDGLKKEYLLERIFRDAKAGQIYEGTNQVQRLLIARDLLKK